MLQFIKEFENVTILNALIVSEDEQGKILDDIDRMEKDKRNLDILFQ